MNKQRLKTGICLLQEEKKKVHRTGVQDNTEYIYDGSHSE